MCQSRELFVAIADQVPRGMPSRPEDLELDWIFPMGWYSTRISVVPGTHHPLLNQYEIFVSRDDVSSYFNESVARAYDRPWYGNILVARYASRDTLRIAHILPGEKSMIDVIVGA